MKEYSTNQRNLLSEFFQLNRDKQFTVDEIADTLCSSNKISKSAIYRNIDRLVNDGEVRRFTDDGQRKSVYQYNPCHKECSHLHLKCLRCGKLYHLDDKISTVILQSVSSGENFKIDEEKSILYGICKSCV